MATSDWIMRTVRVVGRSANISVLAVALLLPTAVTTAAATEKYALLVGINRYASSEIPPLAGCVNDVQAMKLVLEGRYGFPADNVKTLTERQATRSAILAALRDVVARANSGDQVYIHFSGHGSQVKDLDGDEKDDGLDETLLPYDGRTAGVPDITDDELNGILSGLRTQGAVVVLDACHSGTATRSVAIRTRSIPADTRLTLYSAKKPGAAGTRSVAGESAPAYVVMSATGPRESALDASVDGVSRGLFSLALSKVLGVAATAYPPLRIIGEVKNVLQSLQDKVGAAKLPVPQLEGPAGLLTQALFAAAGNAVNANGSAAPQSAQVSPMASPASSMVAGLSMGMTSGNAPTPIRMAPLAPGTVLLIGGALLGATPGAFMAIYADEQAMRASAGAIASAEVTSVSEQDAEARVSPADYVPSGTSVAVALTSGASEPDVRVDLRVPEAVGLGLRSAIQQRFAHVVFVKPQQVATFIVEMTAASGASGSVSVYGAGGLQLLDQFPWSDEAGVAERVAPQLRRSFNSDAIKSLSNPSTSIGLNVSVVSNPTGNNDQRGITVVPSSDRARYRIRAAQEPRSSLNSLTLEIESSVDCFLTIVDVDPAGTVTVLFPNPQLKSGFMPDGFVQARVRSRIPDTLQEPNKAGFFWDYSPPAGLDVVQVFAATDLETASKLRSYLASFAGQSAGAGGTASRGIGASEKSQPLSELRATLAEISHPRGITVVPSAASSSTTTPSSSTARRDWTAVPVTIDIAP